MEWYLSDHIGSTSLMVDENGLEVESSDYFPYGQVRSGGLEKYGFTGQENDADTGLMYYGSRYYSPEYRVFVQPDTLLPDPYNPQALNRYSYALDNPVRYTDPSGHYVETALDTAFILMDLNDIRQDPSDLWAWGALGADGVCAVVPFATGGGLGIKGIKAANEIDNAVDVGRVIEHSGSLATRYGDDTGEALAKMSAEIESKGIVGKNARVTGTLKHTEFKKTVDAWSKEREGAEVFVEQSIDPSGKFVRGNPSGSLRPDVMEIGDDGIVRIYDLKTGNAKLTNNWMNKVDQRLMGTKEYEGVEFYRVKNGETIRVR